MNFSASAGHTDIVRLLLEHGADVNLVDGVSAACAGPAHGWWLQRLTLFELNAQSLDCSFCPYFNCYLPVMSDAHVRAYAHTRHTPRVVRQDGGTALMWAAQNGHTDTVRLLLEHGADVNLVDGVSAACV